MRRSAASHSAPPGAPDALLLHRVLIPHYEAGRFGDDLTPDALQSLYTTQPGLALSLVQNAFDSADWSKAAAALAAHIGRKTSRGERPSCPASKIEALFRRRWPTYAAVARVLGQDEAERYRAMIEAASEDPEVGVHVPDERVDAGWSAAQLNYTITYLHDVICAHLGDTVGMIQAYAARKRSSSSETSNRLRF